MRRALPRLALHSRHLALASSIPETIPQFRKVGAGHLQATLTLVSHGLPALALRPRLSSTWSLAENGGKDEGKANKADQQGLDGREQEIRLRRHQVRRPWHRVNADKPPVDEPAEKGGQMTKGMLLTTPTRLLKLVLPLPLSVEKDQDNNARDYGRAISTNAEIQPLALLVHPQQPLSYLERLIQAELPPVLEEGKEKIPNVYFRAEDTEGSDNRPTTWSEARARDDQTSHNRRRRTEASVEEKKAGMKDKRKGDEEKDGRRWVRWSSSTEVGDFIRDAARGREFAIEVEGYGVEMRVGVPSFGDRTYYMRLRLRRMSRRIDEMTAVKRECDGLARRGANRLAKGGFAVLSAWWGVVYYVTFHTELGWDLVEPVTYLAGLTSIMGGYLWFLYISRDLSYKAAMNVTVSRRQNALYEARGFDLHRWERVVQEANALRDEINKVAVAYDVDWEDAGDVGQGVKEVLDSERRKTHKTETDEDEQGEEEAEEERIEERDGKEEEKNEKK